MTSENAEENTRPIDLPKNPPFSVRLVNDPGKIIHVKHLDQNRYEVEMDGVLFFRISPQEGEWLEASFFFPSDEAKKGKAVTVKGPFLERKEPLQNGWELRFTFTILLHKG